MLQSLAHDLEQGVAFSNALLPWSEVFPPLYQAMICLLYTSLMTPGMAISVYLIPVWLIVLGIGYLFKEKTAKAVKAH